MHAYLIVGRNSKEVEKKVGEMVKKLGAGKIDFEIQKIEQVRDLIRLTRLSFSKKTAMVIKKIDEATKPAQSAFLKELEEPQEKLNYILTASDEEGVLETIVSRCQKIEVRGQRLVDKKDLKVAGEFWKKSAAEKLVFISKINKRDEAVGFVESLILGGAKIKKKDGEWVKMMEAGQKTLDSLRANGNVQLQLTAMVVGLEN